jgi:hypothetical protein
LALIANIFEIRDRKQASAFFFEKKKQKTFIRCDVRKRHDLAMGSGEAYRIVRPLDGRSRSQG